MSECEMCGVHLDDDEGYVQYDPFAMPQRRRICWYCVGNHPRPTS